MDPTTVLTITQTITMTQVLSDTVGISIATVNLAADPVQVFGVTMGMLLIVAMYLFAHKFQMWALIISLIVIAVWIPLSITPLSIVSATVVLFFLMISTLLRNLVTFLK